MNRRLSHQALHHRFDEYRTHADFARELANFCAESQFDKFLFMILPDNTTLETSETPPFFTTSFDNRWIDYYLENNYQSIDPAFIAFAQLKADTPWIFPVSSIKTLSGPVKTMIGKAIDAGLKNLISIPAHTALGATGILSLSYNGNEKDFGKKCQEQLDSIRRYAQFFTESLLLKDANPYKNAYFGPLSVIEKDIIKYLASGYSRSEIADKRQKSLGTIDKQINRILQKLHAKNTAQAVTIALIWKLV